MGLTSQERFETVLRGQLPDRVPVVMMGFRHHGKAQRFATAGRVFEEVPV